MSADRIASLLASATEILHGLGLWDRVVAVSHECDYPPDVDTRPRVTITHIDAAASSKAIDDQVRANVDKKEPLYRIDADRLAELKPDLIVTQAQCDVCAVKYDDVVDAVRNTPALADTEIVALNPKTFDDIFDDIRKVGVAAGVDGVADRFIAELRQRVVNIREISDAIPQNEQRRTVCIEWTDPVMVAANWMPDLIRIAGGRSDMTQAGEPSGYTDWKDVVAFDPEVLVVMPCGFDVQRANDEGDAMANLPGWSELPAVRAGMAFAADGNAYFNRSGPRIVDSLELLAGLMYPDRFAEFRSKYQSAWRPIMM